MVSTDHNSEEAFEDEIDELVAVIGVSIRLPGADNLDAYWDNLRDGVESIISFSTEEMLSDGVTAADMDAPGYVPVGAPLRDIDKFDAAFFGFTPREAQSLDPQRRLFLECVWHAVEDAGYDPSNLPGPVGVYAGQRFSDYLLLNLYANHDFLQKVGHFQALLSNDKDYLAPLISYKLDLDGPSISVQTACSTSLVAVHLGCEALLSHHCNMVLAGATTLRLPQHAGYLYHPQGIFSRDGHCRAFDADATGTVFGNGVGVVLLKRYEDAVKDRDHIYGLILGSSVNNDGGRKVGLTAPAAEGQAKVIVDAMGMADVMPDSVQYLECHGTGTALGDAIEINALSKIYTKESCNSLALGSVKTNLGHLECSAGMAGLVKILLMMKHHTLVPSLHFKTPNPQINFDDTPFHIQTKTEPWPQNGDMPRRAALSSFGIGGTNGHLILEEPPEPDSRPDILPAHVLRLSARSGKALDRMTAALADHLERHPTLLADVAATLHTGRKTFAHRRIMVAANTSDAVTGLREGRSISARLSGMAPPLVFLFPGQGAQYSGMVTHLSRTAGMFRDTLDHGLRRLKSLMPHDITPWLSTSSEAGDQALRRTENAQPALFLVSYALARQCLAWGLQPTAFLGHSIGEYVAATLAEVFTFDDALKLVTARGRIMSNAPGGGMLSVPLNEFDTRARLVAGCEIAALNAPEMTVVSGSDHAVQEMARSLEQAGIQSRLLHTSHAFHSAMMRQARDQFRVEVGKFKLKPPKLPFASNVTGRLITNSEAVSADYWADHLLQPVRFHDGLRALAADKPPAWLEVGPGSTAATFARAAVAGSFAVTTLPKPGSKANDAHALQEAVGRLWLSGIDVDPAAYLPNRYKVPLPGYPFERERFWVDGAPRPGQANVAPTPEPEQASQTQADAPEGNRPAHMGPFEAPVGDIETKLAAIWEDQLGVAPVGRFDDFFELGGHSLLATRVLSRIRDSLAVELALGCFFEAQQPGIAGLAHAVIEARSNQALTLPPLTPVERGQALPLTAAQERMWFLYRIDPASPAYNLPHAFEIDGPINIPAFEGAMTDLVERHEILRCRYIYTDGKPLLELIEDPQISLPLIDLSKLTEAQKHARIQEERRKDMMTPFKLETDPPIRGRILRLGEHQHVILFNMHHIASDGGSFTILSRDLFALYQARADGKPHVLPDLPIQYADYATWQRNYLSGERLSRLETWWRDHLAGAPLVFELDTDHPRPAVAGYHGARLPIRLDLPLSDAVYKISRQHHTTPFMTLLAGFELLLWNRTGAFDFLIGSHITHRDHQELENLVGLFVNQLVLRADLAGNPTFEELLGRVRSDVLGAFAHQSYPFEKLVETLQPERDLSRNPLVQIIFLFQNHPPADAGESNAPINETGDDLVVRDDLRLELYPIENRLEGLIEFRTDLFEPATIQSLIDEFQSLLELAIDQPQLKLDQLAARAPHLSVAEIQALNSQLTRPALPIGKTLTSRIFDVALNQPQAVAVVSTEEPIPAYRNLTYAQLALESRNLARRLRVMGVGAEDKVGLFTERSGAHIIGFMGIMAAGGAWVPLDPQAPANRLDYQLKVAAAQIIVTTQTLADQIPAAVSQGREVVLIDGHHADVDVDIQLPEIAPQQTAYVLFTSGSTGEPKGVAVEHRQLSHYVNGVIDVLDMKPSSYGWAIATTADAGHLPLFPTLSLGGSVHAISAATTGNPKQFANYVQSHHIEDLKFMPSLLRSLQSGGFEAAVLPKRHLVLSGEPAETTWIDTLRRAAPGVRIDNEYGPTETTVGCTVERFDNLDLTGIESWPIGVPMKGVSCYLVDGYDRPVGRNRRGELHIGGDYVARGYIGRPDLTALRFLPDPWADQPGARRYATGDHAVVTEAGKLFFHGRIDMQIKIRGFRVEPGEVENQIKASGLVTQSVVRLVKDPLPRLAAWVVPSGDGDENELIHNLRRHLSENLNPTMVPTAYVVLAALPLSPNGKLNTRALPDPPKAGSGEVILPRTPTERQLAAIWCAVLGLEQVGVDHGFFELGGDSMLSIQILAHATRAGLPMTAQMLFQHQTLAEQAKALDDLAGDNPQRALVLLQPTGANPPLFCVHSAGGMVFSYLELARNLGGQRPFFALQDVNYLSFPLENYATSVETLAEAYLPEVLNAQPQGPFYLAGHSFGGLVALELAQQLESLGHGVAVVFLFDTHPPIEEDSEVDDRLETLFHFAQVMYRMQGRENPIQKDQLAKVSAQDRVIQVSNALQELQGMEEMTPQRTNAILEVFSAHNRAAAAYQPKSWRGKVILCRPRADLTEGEEDLTWRKYLPGLQVQPVSGDHTTMLTQAHAGELAEVINHHCQ